MSTRLPFPPSALPLPPSRHANPFATCWTRPGALPFVFRDGQNADQLVARLAAHGWWGEIVGPHGSGKSTLLEALIQALRAAGCRVHSIALRDGQRWLPRGFLRSVLGTRWLGSSLGRAPRPNSRWGLEGTAAQQWSARPPATPQSATPQRSTLLVIDGYEQLGWLQRWWLKLRCRRAAAGLLVTSHAPTGLPTLVTLAPDSHLVEQLVASLCRRTATAITPDDVAASHACHGSNVREIFFDLYDRHEGLRSNR